MNAPLYMLIWPSLIADPSRIMQSLKERTILAFHGFAEVRRRDMECAATGRTSPQTKLPKYGGALDRLGMEDGDRSASCWSSARIQSGGVGDGAIARIRNSLPPHSKGIMRNKSECTVGFFGVSVTKSWVIFLS